MPAPVMAFAMEPVGDEDKVFTALRRLQEEDPTIDLHRDERTGEEIIAGLSQMHVEVVVDRLRRRFGCEVRLKPPRVPYQETIRRPARAHGRHKKQTGGRGQFGDCHIEIEPLSESDPAHPFEFVDAIKGGVIPSSYVPAVEKGCLEALEHGPVAGAPVRGVRVSVVDGSHHTVDSSEVAFKLAGSIAMKEALADAGAVLLEPVMAVRLSVPDECVGDVIGDLSSRRGRPQGMEPTGGMTEVRAEVPMAEMLTYAPDLRALTGGRGEYTMELERYARRCRGRWPSGWWRPSGRRRRPDGAPGRRAKSRLRTGSSVVRGATLDRSHVPQVDHDQPRRPGLRRVRSHPAARGEGRSVRRRRLASPGLRAVHRPGGQRRLDPGGRRRCRRTQPGRRWAALVPGAPAPSGPQR
jgi:hypothetical protein